jgi:hypothetical protein
MGVRTLFSFMCAPGSPPHTHPIPVGWLWLWGSAGTWLYCPKCAKDRVVRPVTVKS